MPYEKVCIMVAMVISVVLSVLLSGNFGKDVEVVVIDLDNSAYSREMTNRIDASEYMQVTAVLNIGRVPGHEGRVWSRHGKLPWVSYGADEAGGDGDGRALNRGMKGEDVEKMQRALMEKGYALPRWGADGDFGPETEKALRRFQEDSGLIADGVFGRAERGALYGGADKQSGPAPADPMAPRYAVTVRGLGQSDMLALTARWPGAEVTRDE